MGGMIVGTGETVYDRVQFRDRVGMPITGILADTLMQAPWCVTADDGSGVPLNNPVTGLLAGLQVYSYMPSGLDRGMFDISYMPPQGLNGPLFITIHGNVLFSPGSPEADSDYVSGPHTLSWWLPAIKTSADYAGSTAWDNNGKLVGLSEQLHARTLPQAFSIEDYEFDEYNRPTRAIKTYSDGTRILVEIEYTAQGKSLYRESLLQ